jgi:hypothetical protein
MQNIMRSNQNNRFRSVEKGSKRNDQGHRQKNYSQSDENNYRNDFSFEDNDDDYQRFSSSGMNRNDNNYPGDFERDYYGYKDNFGPEESYTERRKSRNSGEVNHERHYFGTGNKHGNEYGAGDNYDRDDEWNDRGSWGGRLDSFYDEDIYDKHSFNDEHSMDSGRNSLSKRYNGIHADESSHRYQNENAGNISDRELSGRNSRRSTRRSRNRDEY